MRDIAAGEELSYDYKYRMFGLVKTRCLCGSKNCSGFLGEPPKKVVEIDPAAAGKSNKRKVCASVPRGTCCLASFLAWTMLLLLFGSVVV